MMLLALPILASAYDCQVDGIYYNLKSSSKEAEVTFAGIDHWGNHYSGYSGHVSVPEKFTYEGVEYSVKTIGYSAFRNCSSLISVAIGNSVTNINGMAFYNCIYLTTVVMGNSVNTINSSAFEGCSSLVSISIPNSVLKMDTRVFYGCSSLSSVILPNTITTIEEQTFYGCSSLASITIPNSVTDIGKNAFYGCSSLTSLDIPNTVTVIKEGTFKNCRSLVSLIIPNSVTSIGDMAFMGCRNLVSITIPNSVKSIEVGAFADCNKLEEVYCYAETVPSVKTSAFDNSNLPNATLYVPAGALNDYKTIAPWNEFGSIIALEGDENKCATPTINYADKKLTFSCETEGVEYHYTITDSDIKSDVSSSIDLSATYEISVYATKSGYTNSDVATATLVWTDAIFTVTTPDTPTSAKAVQESIPVLISANGGVITVKSEQEGQPVAVYTADGKALGSANVKDGQATVATNIQRGEIVIVKVGGRSVKVKM